MESTLIESAAAPGRSHDSGLATRMPVALGKRIANIVLTAQVQFAYACAMDARQRAERASSCIQGTWPATPLRELLLDVYRAQAATADAVASGVLARARERCGLAFARI